MQLSEKARSTLTAALMNEREKLVAERERRVKDVSRKWNDSDERIAISLDAQRDELDLLVAELHKASGTFEW